jgi:drug/metabolite transporter (DMT)-like permease
MLIGPDLLHQLGTHVLAEIAGLAAACAYGFSAVYARRLRGLSPLTMASGQLTVATVMLIPVVVLFERPAVVLAASAGAIAAMVSLALLSTALAYVIYFRLIRRAGASNTVLTAFLIPVSAILLGVLLLGETITLRQLAGMAAIAAGLAAIDGRPARMIAGWFGGARTSNKA